MIADTGKKAIIAMRVSARARSLIAALACLSIGSCAVGPDFKKPAAPNVSEYTAQPLSTTVASPGVEGGRAQRFSRGADISGDWWALFHSRALADLVEQSLKNNADLKAAQATLRQAHEKVLKVCGGIGLLCRHGRE